MLISTVDVEDKSRLLEIIENTHKLTNHRGIMENFEEMKNKFFFPKLKILINQLINSCQICQENKYDRKPIKKKFIFTETLYKPNQIVHFDIFHVQKKYFLTSIDRFTKLATAHDLSDKNMCTVKIKLQERISYLGKPELAIFDNEFNNTLIKMFCNENGIQMHFTTPHSHTGNGDIERLHSTLLEHIRIIKNTEDDSDTNEVVLKAVGYYNNSIHSVIKIKPMDFINANEIDMNNIRETMLYAKNKNINYVNQERETVNLLENKKMYVRNPGAIRNKTAKRYLTYNYKSYPNKLDVANVKRPLKFCLKENL